MKKMIATLLAILLAPLAVSAASYSVDEKKAENISGINRIVFELRSPNCVLCINTGNQSYNIAGGGKPGVLELMLEGDLNSNNKKAVPSLITQQNGNVLYVRLYNDSSLFFALVQSGSVQFRADLPEYFDGDIEVFTSSGDLTIADLNADKIKIKSSSGDTNITRLGTESLDITASSGDVNAYQIDAVHSISIKASSGDINLDESVSSDTDIQASSGRITIGNIRSDSVLSLNSSSGRISAESLESKSVSVDAKSGRITIEKLTAENLMANASSGDIKISNLSSQETTIDSSSGKTVIDVAEFNGDINIKSSSGDVIIKLPEGSGFLTDLIASSGKIKSEFRLLTEVSGDRKNEIRGEANGGGYSVRVKASSGDITIEEK